MGMGPLFPVEPVTLTAQELQGLAVAAFPDDWARENIWAGFLTFLDQLSKIPVEWTVFVDGSFVTDKAGPDDIDLLVVAGRPTDGYLPEQALAISALSGNRDRLKRELRCDVQLLVETLSSPTINEQIDQVLNLFTLNEFGPPKRSVRLLIPELT